MAEVSEERRAGQLRARRLIAAIVVGFVVLVVIIGSQVKPGATPPPAPATPVSASELAQAFADNPVGAQGRYGDRPLQVTGTVGDIITEGSHPIVDLLPGPAIVAARFPIEAPGVGALKRGQTVAVRCAFLVAGDKPLLNDCGLLP